MALTDRFHAGTTDPGLHATVGSTELGAAVVGGKFRTEINALPTAELKLSTTLLAGQPVDYFGTVAVQLAGRSVPHFTGNVVTADPVEEEIVLDCQTHPTLTESKVGFFESLNADAREIMHLMTRSGGLSEDLVNIEGLDQLPLEMVEVLAPLTGVVVDAPLRLGHLSLLDPSESMPSSARSPRGRRARCLKRPTATHCTGKSIVECSTWSCAHSARSTPSWLGW